MNILFSICVEPKNQDFNGYSLGNHGNHITQVHERNIEFVTDLWEAGMSVDIFEHLRIPVMNFLQAN